ncbi:MAG TPA: sulfurtransferase [Chromatiales bacterium]|nr:sulfurtransferase [Chromatiales bacterium]
MTDRFDTLIGADELVTKLGSPNWRIVDCRFDLMDPEAGRQAWAQSHIPGAVHADLDRDLAGPVSPDAGGRHPLPDTDEFRTRLGAWGIDTQTQVVVYDDGPGIIAGRLWWMLRWLGHRDVAVLDGGWASWLDAGHSVDDREPRVEYTQYTGEPGSMPEVDARQVHDALQTGTATLIDVRASERFNGEHEPLDKVAGHVPGALNLPLTVNLDEQGRFHSPEQLRQIYQPLSDGQKARQLICMCGSGVSACHSLLAMEIAGLPGASLYVGSWSDWISDPSRPVAGANATEPD